jgi:hypothetical protein
MVVLDAQGLALPGVTVEVAQTETGLSRTATSDVDGAVRVAALPPGSYTMKFTLAGFNPLEQTIVLRVGQVARLTATMTQVTGEAITVAGEAPMVDITRMSTSSNVVPEQIAELPVPSREFEKLAFITPGVQRERGGFRFITNGPVIGSGGNASQATFMVDGVDFTDQALGLARARFSQDAIREFRVINNRFDTEIGGSQGGAISVVTKSGSNAVAGSVFGFYRGDSLRTQGELETGTQDFTDPGGFTSAGRSSDKTHLASYGTSTENIALFRPQGAFNPGRDIAPVHRTSPRPRPALAAQPPGQGGPAPREENSRQRHRRQVERHATQPHNWNLTPATPGCCRQAQHLHLQSARRSSTSRTTPTRCPSGSASATP